MWILVSILVLLLGLIIPLFGFHLINEGCVGVYWTFGILSPEVALPGYHLQMPYMTKVLEVPGRMKTMKKG